MEVPYKKRIRVEVSTSVKGVITWSCTVELLDEPQKEVLAESDKLVRALKKRYQAPVETA